MSQALMTKVNGYSLKGSIILFLFLLPSSGESIIKKRKICPNSTLFFNPIALRKAKIVCNFGLSECNKVK